MNVNEECCPVLVFEAERKENLGEKKHPRLVEIERKKCLQHSNLDTQPRRILIRKSKKTPSFVW